MQLSHFNRLAASVAFPVKLISSGGIPSSGFDLQLQVKAYADAAVTANTRRAYRADIEHFIAWGGSIPCSPDRVAEYLATYASILSVATLKRRIASISKAHKLLNYPTPTSSDEVLMTLKGISRVHGRPQRQATALLKDDLILALAVMPSDMRAIRDKAILLLGFCAALRRSELCRVEFDHLNFTSEGIILTLPRSKTDQAGEGRTIAVPLGRGKVCPVNAVTHWLAISGIKNGPLFRGIDGANLASKRLCDRSISNIIKLRMGDAGYPEAQYSGHSLRSGLATSAAQQGFSSWDIRRQTGHKSDAMLQRYIRNGGHFRNNAGGLF